MTFTQSRPTVLLCLDKVSSQDFNEPYLSVCNEYFSSLRLLTGTHRLVIVTEIFDGKIRFFEGGCEKYISIHLLSTSPTELREGDSLWNFLEILSGLNCRRKCWGCESQKTKVWDN